MEYEGYKKAKQNGHDIYSKAKKSGVIDQDRWLLGLDHHPKSIELMYFLEKHDFNNYSNYFEWKIGDNDGEVLLNEELLNGEILMYEMDAYFEQKDLDKK